MTAVCDHTEQSTTLTIASSLTRSMKWREDIVDAADGTSGKRGLNPPLTSGQKGYILLQCTT